MNIDEGPAIEDHHKIAAKKLSTVAQSYFFGGAGQEVCLKENAEAFKSLRIRPRVLRPVQSIDTRLNLHESLPTLSFPLLVAPMALQTLAHPQGEIAVATAARRVGIPMVLSMMTGSAVESVTSIGAPVMQQIYVMRDRELTLAIAQRSRDAGAVALVVTVDAPYLGSRRRDEKSAFSLPTGVSLANFTSTALLFPKAQQGSSALATFGQKHFDPTIDFDIIQWLKREIRLPVWVKGVLRADDARKAVQAGAAGIMVSNHGGRQLDSALSSTEALEEIVEAVNGAVPIVVDSGIREPEDIIKACALGADAVMVGRPVLAALAADGERGVLKLLQQMKNGCRLAMALSGASNCGELDRSLVVTPTDKIIRQLQMKRSAKL